MNWPWAVVTCISVICGTIVVVIALAAVGLVRTGPGKDAGSDQD